MIDTLRFKIPLSRALYNSLRAQSIEVRKYDVKAEHEIFRISTADTPLGSFDRKISIFLPDIDMCFLEFSLPKHVYGHNVFMLYPKDIIPSIYSLHRLLVSKFGAFTEPEKWIVNRLDLCYAWKFKDHSESEAVLDILRSFDFPRKKKSTFDSSVMYVGSSYSVKFYLKDDEFYKHDFKILRDSGYLNLAYNMFEHSKGVLRFEVTLRKRYLDKMFKSDMTIFDFNELWYTSALQLFLSKFLNGFNLEFMKLKDVKKRLFAFYGIKKGGRLFIFYHFINSQGKKELKDIYAPSTVWQYCRELKNAGISLSSKSLEVIENFSLSIPSDKKVN